MLESFNVCWQGDQNLFSENILEHIVHCLTKLFQHICNIRQGSQILSIEIKALQRKEWHFQQPLSLRDFYNRFLKCLKHFRQIWPKVAIFCENPQKYHFRMKTVFFPSQNLGWWWNPWGRDHQVWNSLIYRRENQKRQKTRTFTLSAIFPFFFSHTPPHPMAQQSPRIISTKSENHHRMQNLPTGHLPKNIQKSTDIIDTNVPQEKKLLTMVRSVSEDKLYDTIEFNEFLQVTTFSQTSFLFPRDP